MKKLRIIISVPLLLMSLGLSAQADVVIDEVTKWRLAVALHGMQSVVERATGKVMEEPMRSFGSALVYDTSKAYLTILKAALVPTIIATGKVPKGTANKKKAILEAAWSHILTPPAIKSIVVEVYGIEPPCSKVNWKEVRGKFQKAYQLAQIESNEVKTDQATEFYLAASQFEWEWSREQFEQYQQQIRDNQQKLEIIRAGGDSYFNLLQPDLIHMLRQYINPPIPSLIQEILSIMSEVRLVAPSSGIILD